MFTMTATKYSTCPVSGLTIEPGDTITRAGNKYTPWSLTKSEIDRKQRVARSMPTPAPTTTMRVRSEDSAWNTIHGSYLAIVHTITDNRDHLTSATITPLEQNPHHPIGVEVTIPAAYLVRDTVQPAPKPSGICPLCLNDVYPGDAYCGDCGVNLTDGYLDETHDERTARPTAVTDAYTIATDDDQPVILAEVRHIDATPRRYAMLGTEAQATPFQVAAPDTTPEPIAPQKQPESRTEAPTPITADTVTEQYAYINPKDLVSLMVSATKQVRDDIKQARADAKAEGTKYDSFHGLRESVRIITLPDGTIYAGQLMGDDAGQTTCTKGTGIDACFDQDQASALARYLIDTKSRIPRMVRLSIEGKYLVIEQESTVKGRWDKMRFAHQIEPTNTGQMSGWPVKPDADTHKHAA